MLHVGRLLLLINSLSLAALPPCSVRLCCHPGHVVGHAALLGGPAGGAGGPDPVHAPRPGQGWVNTHAFASMCWLALFSMHLRDPVLGAAELVAICLHVGMT